MISRLTNDLFTPAPFRKMRGVLHFALSIALVFVLGLQGCNKPPVPSKVISYTADHVEGLELVFVSGASNTDANIGFVSPGAAKLANYGFFDHQGHRYISVGGGSVVVRPQANTDTQYLVRETAVRFAERIGGSGDIAQSVLEIIDKRSGKVMAKRDLIQGEDEDSHGWVYRHAIGFILQVLHNDREINRRLTPPYPPASAEIVGQASSASTPYSRLERAPSNCPPNVHAAYGRTNNRWELRMPTFTFVPEHPTIFIACDADMIVIGSGTWGYDLFLDIVAMDGKASGQAYVRLPIPGEGDLASPMTLQIRGGMLQLAAASNTRAASSASDPHQLLRQPFKEFEISLPVPALHAIRE